MDAIVVIVDRFMKMIRLKATTTNISLEGIVKIYRDEIWKLLWQPLVIKTNSITSNKSLEDEYLVGNLQENSTRSLFLIKVLFIQIVHGPCY